MKFAETCFSIARENNVLCDQILANFIGVISIEFSCDDCQYSHVFVEILASWKNWPNFTLRKKFLKVCFWWM